MRTDQPGQLGNLAKHIPGRDDVLDRLDRLERRTYGLSSSPQTTFIEGGQTVPYILKLSPTDAAHNDAELVKAIASGKTIYVPPVTVDSNGHGFPWPIAAAHYFGRRDLIGVGSSSLIPYGVVAGTANSNVWGSYFICVSSSAGLHFNGGPGRVTGGFTVDGGWLAYSPWSRDLNEDGGGDVGRIFQNIYVTRAGPSPTRGTGTGMIVSSADSYQDDAVLVVTSVSGDVQSTSALHLQTMTASDVQTALEGLSNVGAGQVTVTCVETGTSPVQGGPFLFTLTDSTAVLSVQDETYDYGFNWRSAPVTAVIAGNQDDRNQYGVIINNTYLDTYQNIAWSASAGHGAYIGATECKFDGLFVDGANGHAIGEQCGECTFTLADIEVAKGSFVYGLNSNGQNVHENFTLFGAYLTASPMVQINGNNSNNTYREFFARGPGTPVTFYVDDVVTVDGYCDIENGLIVLADIGDLFQIKADMIGFDPATQVIYLAGALPGQLAPTYAGGLISAMPVQLEAVATVDRPTGTWPAGSVIFDTDLIKPIWADGAGGWVDATGASV